jgi:hypothetical protein
VSSGAAGGGAGRRWGLGSALLLAALAALALATFRDFAPTWDEEIHAYYGEVVASWYRTSGADTRALENMQHYGGLFDLAAHLATEALPLGPFEARHLVNALFGLAGLLGTWRLGALLGGARAGFLSLLLLALTPFWWGHSFANSKDLPFAALYVVALGQAIASARRVPALPWRSALATGAAAGLAMAVRAGGMVLLGLVGMAWLGALLLSTPAGERRRALPALALRLLAATAVAWALMVATWPWALLSPLRRPFEAIGGLSNFFLSYPVLYDGRVFQSTALPRTYLPTWFALTLPEPFFVAALAALGLGAWAIARRRAGTPVSGPGAARWAERGVVAAAVVLLPAYAIAIRANVYDGQRHFLFIVPPLAALAGVALSGAFDALPAGAPRRSGAVALALACALVLADAVRLHPYEYVYFNRIVAGGLRGAAGRYETDYWGASYREATRWLIDAYQPATPRITKVANCSREFLTETWLGRDPRAAGRFQSVMRTFEADVVVATARNGCAAQLEKRARLLHTVARDGAPLAWIFEVR